MKIKGNGLDGFIITGTDFTLTATGLEEGYGDVTPKLEWDSTYDQHYVYYDDLTIFSDITVRYGNGESEGFSAIYQLGNGNNAASGKYLQPSSDGGHDIPSDLDEYDGSPEVAEALRVVLDDHDKKMGLDNWISPEQQADDLERLMGERD